jgi:hypothetical protein
MLTQRAPLLLGAVLIAFAAPALANFRTGNDLYNDCTKPSGVGTGKATWSRIDLGRIYGVVIWKMGT